MSKLQTGAKAQQLEDRARDLFTFQKAWNDIRNYPANHDLERHFEKKMKRIREKAQRYEAFRAAHPEFALPPLLLRRVTTGGLIAIPPGVIEQLDEFRIDVERLKKASALVVTAAQYGAPLNKSFWATLKQYEEARHAPIVVMPIKYGPVTTVYQKEVQRRLLTSTFPDELKGHLLFDDFVLAGGELMLNVTRLRPTLSRFLTDPICEMGGIASQIFAAPVLELEHRPRVGRKYPKAIMTSGACTYPNYQVDNIGQQDRTGEIATEAHTFAAIVVEFEKDGTFHFRQLHANKRGEFYDVNPLKGGADFFTSRGVEHRDNHVSALVCGDWHTGKTDPDVRKGTFGKHGMVKSLSPETVVLHDFFDGDSASWYEERQGTRRAYKAPLQWDSLEDELLACQKELEWISAHTDAEIAVVASNHPEFVTEYIETGRYRKDNRNLAIGLELELMMVNDLRKRKPEKHEAIATDPVILWLREHCPSVRMLTRQDTLTLPRGAKKPILVSMHGDQGIRGGETRSTKAFRKMNQRLILGHNHSGIILGPVWRVGVSTPRMVSYVRGPATDWTNTHCAIFRNSQRQLLNFVKGRWYGEEHWQSLGLKSKKH